jgi:hypothetical protein
MDSTAFGFVVSLFSSNNHFKKIFADPLVKTKQTNNESFLTAFGLLVWMLVLVCFVLKREIKQHFLKNIWGTSCKTKTN